MLKTIIHFVVEKQDYFFQLLGIAVILVLVWVLIRANRIVFDKLKKKQGGIHLVFFERVNKALILVSGFILSVSGFGGVDSIWKTFLGGTAIISAVLAFAAQDVIKDILAGMMISVYKPFEIGNRIELEDGTTGIVQDITMRHVVLAAMEEQKIIIPNSRLNSMRILNYSYHSGIRSAKFSFHIAYGSDVEKAIRVIRQAIAESSLTIPGRKTKKGKDYGDVYFMAFENSSLKLNTIVYYKSTVSSEALISDINLRVNRALAENGIEIPYNYINVVQKSPSDSPKKSV